MGGHAEVRRVETLPVWVVNKFCPIHQKLTTTSWALHQGCVVGVTRRAVILKESRGQHPQQNSLTHFKTMTTAISFDRVSTDQNQNQNQIQNLTDDQLEMVFGGANETCRQWIDPRTGVTRMYCSQIVN